MRYILWFLKHYQLWFFAQNWLRYGQTQESGVGSDLIYEITAEKLLVTKLQLQRDASRNRVKSMQTLIQLSMQCPHERILSTVGEVGLEVILNCSLYSIFTNALKQARWIQRDDCDEVYDEDDCNDAGQRTVGLGCFSPVQRLDEQREASNYYLCTFFRVPYNRG
jgi:hypothetical protein